MTAPAIPPAFWPIMVEVVRGTTVESRHHGAAVVADAAGAIMAAWGDPAWPIFPRSAVKPLQALPLVESGALDRFGLTPADLALACASHGGTPAHTARVAAWLDRLGLGVADLACGAHPPSDAAAADALIRAGEAPSALHNNCSGKHAGFLTTALHLGESLARYLAPDHPVQRRVAAVLGEMTGTTMAAAPCAVDGCGIPTFGLPLSGLARAMARLGRPAGLGPARARAAERVRAAMAAHPDLVAGPGRLCTVLMRLAPQVTIKVGAEGVFLAALPRCGLGVALKIEDGAKRAAEVAIVALLDHLGAFEPEQRAALADWLMPPLRNVAGNLVGVVRPAESWLGA